MSSDFKVHHEESVKLTCDNISALSLCKNPVFHDHTKHIEMDVPFIREKVVAGIIELVYVHTSRQSVDVFTKSLAYPQFPFLLDKMSMPNIHSPHTHLEWGYQ